MHKKADLVPYAIMSLLLGGALLLMFYRIGALYGDSSNRIDDYMVRDSALFITALHALPGNMLVNFFYPIHDKIVDVNASRIAILREVDEVFREHFRHRVIGRPDSTSQRLENSQYFEISKTSNDVGINVRNNLDVFSCPENKLEVDLELIQVFFSTNNDNFEAINIFARGLRDNLQNRLGIRFVDDVNNIRSSSTEIETDISFIVSMSESNDFIAYVHYENLLNREIACRIINEFILDENIDGNRFQVYSVDPDLYEIYGMKISENMIFLKMGDAGKISRNTARLQNIIYRVLRGYI